MLHWKVGCCALKIGTQQSRLSILLAAGLVITLLIPAGVMIPTALAGARNPCQEANNLTFNCGFDDFVDRFRGEKRLQIPDGWWYFVLSGDPDFRPADDTYWGAPSLVILSDGMFFSAGIYQQVKVAPGVIYQTDLGWAAARCNFQECGNMERRLGLDPTGGTDPLAPSVVWSRIEAGGDKWPDLTVSARAVGPQMTVFVWVNHPSSSGLDEVYFDAVGLWPDPNQPVATVTPVPSATPTRKPPTSTPKPLPPTVTPTEPPTAVPTETETPTPEPTETPTPSPTPTWTATPSPLPPTNTPTSTPSSTLTPLAVAQVAAPPAPRPTLAVAERPTRSRPPQQRVLLYIAAGAFAGALILGVVLVLMWARSRRTGPQQD
jgi:hypothetical protein